MSFKRLMVFVILLVVGQPCADAQAGARVLIGIGRPFSYRLYRACAASGPLQLAPVPVASHALPILPPQPEPIK
jgi:hypothetical protein